VAAYGDGLMWRTVSGELTDREPLTKEEIERAVRAVMDKRKKLDENWMRVAPGTDAAIWRPWSRETGEL
jgi:hypothetical protein